MWKFSRALMEAFESSRSSPEQAEASSGATSSDGRRSAQSSGSRTLPQCCYSDKMTDSSHPFPSGMTSRRLTDDRGEAVLTWYLEAFLARTSALPARVPASPARVRDFGVRWRALSTRFDPDSLGWRTRPSLWDEGLTSSLPTLPRWGSLHDGELWERVTLVPITNATESGFSLPTPVKYEAQATSPGNHYKGLGWRAKHAPGLLLTEFLSAGDTPPVDIKPRFLPTPIKSEDRASKYTPETSYRHFTERSHQVHLAQVARDLRMQPRPRVVSTPTVFQVMVPPASLEKRMEGKRGGRAAVPLVEIMQREQLAKHRARVIMGTPTATSAVRSEAFGVGRLPTPQEIVKRNLPTPTADNGLRDSSTSEHYPGMWQSPGHPEYGELCPEWVEWIMGWPIGWTSLEPMNHAAFEAWEQGQSGSPGDTVWWHLDPTDAEGSGITKTVPKPPTKALRDVRDSRISALGNGQVSAACAAAFMHLHDLEDPQPTKDSE